MKNIDQEISLLEQQATFDKKKLEQRFLQYARTLKKLPTESVYKSFLIEALANLKLFNSLLPSEQEYVAGRKIWTDVVSETYEHNKRQDVKAAVIARIKQVNAQVDLEKIYAECIRYLKEDSVIVVSFKGDFLEKNFTNYRLENMYEQKSSRGDTYAKNRDKTEAYSYQHLSKDLYQAFLKNPHARPKYGVLFLKDKNHPIDYAYKYGPCFIVLKSLAKLNNSNIDDDKAGLIFAAVKANKDILMVKLFGNPISQDLLNKINNQLKENLLLKAKILFEKFYQPERDFSYELPLAYQNSVLSVAYKLTTQRYQETLNIIQLQCRLPFNKAQELFVATYNTWLNQTNLDSIRASSARKIADTILEKIYQFKEKPGFFCKKTFVLDDGEEIMLPKLLGEMLDFYINQGYDKCDPEQFIEKCIDIAKKMPCNNKIQLMASVSALEVFCKTINQIQRPEQLNFTSFSLNCA